MSSTEFSQIRRRGNAATRITSLVRAFQNFASTQLQVENTFFKTINRPVSSRLKFHDPFVETTVKPVNRLFYMPFEPDGDVVVGKWKLDHNGRYFVDGSGFGNHITIVGNPILKRGVDNGFVNTLYAYLDDENRGFIPDNATLNTSAYKTGFSLTARIYPEDISDPAANTSEPGKYRCIVSKHDSNDASRGFNWSVRPDGSLQFTYVVNGQKSSVVTPSNTIVVDTTTDPIANYDIAVVVPITNNVAGTLKMYVDGTEYTTTTTNHLSLVSGDTDKALRVGALFPNQANRNWWKWRGGVQDLHIYKDKILTQAEITNLHTNKFTITNIPNGKVAILGMALFTGQVSYFGGFDSQGFDAVGFDVS